MFRLFGRLSILFLIFTLLAACGNKPSTAGQEVTAVAGDEEAPLVEGTPVQEQAEAEQPTVAPSDTSPPPTEIVPSDTPTLPPPVHSDFPGGAIFIDAQRVKDCASGGSQEVDMPVVVGTGCDVWEENNIERPLGSTLVDYDPNLDIVQQEFGFYDGWYYARMLLFEESGTTPDLNNSYGIELDMDIDSDGDILLYVRDPQSLAPTEWTTEGVFAWRDTDDDVGGLTPVEADSEPFAGNGYEEKIFESGYGDDADLVWARVSPGAAYAVEFAFKDVLLQGDDTFQWWMWASREDFLPDKFDYVDVFAADVTYYLDNSCRWLYGIPPQDLPNICLYYKPGPESAPGQCYCPPCSNPTGAQCPPCSCP